MRLQDFKRVRLKNNKAMIPGNDAGKTSKRRKPHPFRRKWCRLPGTKKGPDVADRAVEVLGEDA